MPWTLLLLYCVLILLASLAGGLAPIFIQLSHRRMQVAVSLVAGVMLGIGVLHLLPHALLEAPGSIDLIFLWLLVGFLLMFFVERFFCFHHHEVPQDDHEHHASHGEETHELTWGGAAIGLTLHTVIAGVALAASVKAESGLEPVPVAAGLGTFLVIFLHKPFDSLTITTLMSVGGWSTSAKHVVNGVFALMIPLGVLLFYLGFGHVEGGSQALGCALAFSAGTFLCVAMSDLLPELQFHRHDRVMLSAALLLGLSVAWGISTIESGNHGHQYGPAIETNEHGHEHR
ncbi:MAG: ZIP family metal transporter [Thermoguttaceae bacterium]